MCLSNRSLLSRVRAEIKLLVLFLMVPFLLSALPYAPRDLIDTSKNKIDRTYQDFEKLLHTKLDLFIADSKDHHFDSAYLAWESLFCHFIETNTQLGQTIHLSSDDRVKKYAQKKTERVFDIMKKKLQDTSLKRTFIQNGLAAFHLSPQQRLITRKILSEYGETTALTELAKYKEANFSIRETSAQSLELENLSVATANILCFPGKLSYYFGGAAPWPVRLKKIAAVLQQTAATIICLQEVWDPEAAVLLMSYLKDTHSFFVYGVGSQSTTLDLQNIGFNSGLFIASKIPLYSVIFEKYVNAFPLKSGISRGALLAKCTLKGQEISLVTTHLNHGNNDNAWVLRKEQLLSAASMLQRSLSPKGWGFLLGDLNINAFTEEFEQSGITELFSIPYLQGQRTVTEKNMTSTPYFEDLITIPPDQRKNKKVSFELLDYCIAPTTLHKNPLSQTIVPLFSIENPDEILSDHHLLLTVWELEQPGKKTR